MEKGNEKVIVNVPEGASTIEVVLREGTAAKILDPIAPIKIAIIGVLNSPFEFLTKRINQPEQINQKRCRVEVDREQITITLITNEDDAYTRGEICGRLQLHHKFLEFGVNQGKEWTPNDLGQFLKMNRAFFINQSENMQLVTELKNFTAKIDSEIRNIKTETGSFETAYSGVVSSNLPKSFKINLPIFKGVPADEFEIEFYASVNGRSFTLQLMSPGAMQALEDLRDKVIDEQLALIRELAPDIAIIEV